MKGIKKTLIASAFACAAFNAQAEVDPWGYGLKGSIGVSSPINYGQEVKIGGKKAQGSFIGDLSFGGGIYGEYAFTNWFGMELGLGYMKQGSTLEGEAEKKEENDTKKKNNDSISIASHAVVVPLSLCFYPMGREDELGILKVLAGVVPAYRFKTTCKAHGQEVKFTGDQEKELQNLGFGAAAGVGYEFPFALSIEARYTYDFVDIFKKDLQTIFSTSNNVSGLKKLNTHGAAVTLGYNFAPLFCS